MLLLNFCRPHYSYMLSLFREVSLIVHLVQRTFDETRWNFCECSVASKSCNPMNMVTGHCAVAYPILIFFGTRPAKRSDIRYPVIGWSSFPVYTQLPFSHWLCHETFHRVLTSSRTPGNTWYSWWFVATTAYRKKLLIRGRKNVRHPLPRRLRMGFNNVISSDENSKRCTNFQFNIIAPTFSRPL